MKTRLIVVLTLFFVMFVSLSLNVASCDGTNASNSVLTVSVEGEITMATETMMEDALSTAEAGGTRLVIVKLNTPGGEVSSVQKIMDLFENSKIPIAAFVCPPGATAWSGGTYVLMASHIAIMASGTTIGSCQPVLSTGQIINASKYLNAYASLMIHHARLHNRNETIAGLFVTKNINLGPEDALESHVIELIANDIHSLLEKLEGFTLIRFETELGTLVWKLVPNNEAQNYSFVQKLTFNNISDAKIGEYKPGIQTMFLEFLLNPLISSLLLIMGMFLLFIGFKTPGFGTEIAGGICVFLALIALGAIGITPGAVLLFALGALLILAEIKTHIGVLAISGAVCMVLGSLLLFPSPNWLIYYKISEQIQQFLVAVSIGVSLLFAFIVYKVAEAKRRRVVTGSEALIGAHGIAVSDIKPKGEVRVLGEFWQAKTEDKAIRKGEKVEVVRRDGMFLVVKSIKEKV